MPVSIITIVKNHSAGLIETYGSVASQLYTDWEMIIVVGRSDDDTLSVAKVIETSNAKVRILEQEDKGIYSAMNQGLLLARGKSVWFLNAGDKFATEEVLGNAIVKFENINVGVLIGQHRVIGSNRRKIFKSTNKKITKLRFALMTRSGCHQAMLFRMHAIKRFDGFNVKYSLASDFDLVLKIIEEFGAYGVSETFAEIEPGGRADQGIFLVHKQKHQIRLERIGGFTIFIVSLIWTLLARTKIIFRLTRKGNFQSLKR
jgi:glycosyltransferase involved in cell wall biosynthesis